MTLAKEKNIVGFHKNGARPLGEIYGQLGSLSQVSFLLNIQ